MQSAVGAGYGMSRPMERVARFDWRRPLLVPHLARARDDVVKLPLRAVRVIRVGRLARRHAEDFHVKRMPLHQIGMVAMGLAILDCADCERLAEVCRSRRRYTFCVCIAPLRVPGGSASAVNPLALF